MGARRSRASNHKACSREETVSRVSAVETGRALFARRFSAGANRSEFDAGDFCELHAVGENVAIQDYGSPGDAWYLLGTTPLQEIRIPNGYFRWRLSKAGTGEFVSAPFTTDKMQFSIPASDAMVSFSGGGWGDLIDFVGFVRYELPAYDINRFEITNREYQQFVDQGGYNKREYWREKFIKDGRELSWQEAKDLFRDATGRTGPATWEEGHFPEDQADYPVAGVSWYEAAAYAVFAGKSLPALAQWYKAAPPEWLPSSVNLSNFGGHGPVAVGTSPGVGPYGIYDLAGNVREWCVNMNESGERFILGGAWGTQPYLAFDPEALPSFDRSPMNGFRLVSNKGPVSASLVGPIVRTARDFSKAKPVSDDVFQAYRRSVYAYDNKPLNIQTEAGVEDTPYWTKTKVTIDAGYGNERLPVYVFLPKNVHPPFQSVVFFPSAHVLLMPSSGKLGDLQFVDYVIKSGRALVYPVYRGTYERLGGIRTIPGIMENLQLVVDDSKEVRRSVDYLEALPDQFDSRKIAYLGVSQGGAYGVIFATLEDRFKTVIFLDGGFFLRPVMPARDQVNFAPRLKKPMLMVNGRYDFTFSLDRAQLPFFRMIGTPERDKKRLVFDTPHDVSQEHAALSREVLAWLDTYLGRVN